MNSFFKKLKDQDFILNGWLSIPNTLTAEAMSKMGWDTVTIDLQHGQNDYSSSIAMVQSISYNSIPFVRVPWNEPGIIMRMLDLGVIGIIAPMINTKQDCEKFVSYCYYPPNGQRSFGPMRAQLHYGLNYYSRANENIASFAMIETKEAVENIDAILSVPNLTGIYIGPGDMSSSYGFAPKFDVTDDPVYSNIEMIVEKANEKGKIAGIHNGTTDYAKKMIKIGYKFVTISSDFRSMSAHAQGVVNDMRNIASDKSSSTTY